MTKRPLGVYQGIMIDPKIFKAYDIRAIYPTELDEEGIYQIGRAFVEMLGVKEVVLGYDMRVSVPKLKPHLIAGINDAGAKVIDIGMTGTEVLYFSAGHFKFESGMMLTASHNPSEYIGIKMVKNDSYPISSDNGIFELRDLCATKNYQRLNLPTNVETLDPIPQFKEKINSLANLSNFKKMKVVVDAGNGIGGQLFQKIFDQSNLEIVPLYFEPDGSFPNHEPNPFKDENVAELRKKVVEEKADLGIALDGDGDRVFFTDHEGNSTIGYYLVSILAKKILEKYPGGKIVHESRNSWAILDEVTKAGGIPVEEKAGHSFIKTGMRKADAVFAGETSSHFFYKDLYFADSSMLSIALLFEMITLTGQTLKDLLKPYREKYFISGEFNYEVKDASRTLDVVRKHLESQGLNIDEMDGIAADKGRDWHVSLRMSNTEPVVRLNVEGKSQEIVDQMKSEIESLIQSS